jgi:enolase
MLVPAGAASFSEALRVGVECYHSLKALLKDLHDGKIDALFERARDKGGFYLGIVRNHAWLDEVFPEPPLMPIRSGSIP